MVAVEVLFRDLKEVVEVLEAVKNPAHENVGAVVLKVLVVEQSHRSIPVGTVSRVHCKWYAYVVFMLKILIYK